MPDSGLFLCVDSYYFYYYILLQKESMHIGPSHIRIWIQRRHKEPAHGQDHPNKHTTCYNVVTTSLLRRCVLVGGGGGGGGSPFTELLDIIANTVKQRMP